MALTLLTLALAAQDTPAAAPTPIPTATAVPIPAAPVIVLPTPAALPTPRATPAPRATPTPQPTPTPTPSPTPSAAPTPEPESSPAAPVVPVAQPTPAPSPTVATTPVAEPRTVEQGGWAWWWLVLAALGGAAVSALLLRRRPAPVLDDDVVATPPPQPAPRSATVVSPPPTPPTPPPARLGFVLRPTRAGLNLLSAVVEAELTVTNVGPEAAQDIRIAATLTSVHDGHEAVLAAIIAGEEARPAVAPFALSPGETRTLRVVAAQPRDAIQPMTANGRPMLVPLMAINCRYMAGGTRRQAAQSFAVGIERADSPKLAPFWLDQPPRTVTEVGARPHTERIER